MLGIWLLHLFRVAFHEHNDSFISEYEQSYKPPAVNDIWLIAKTVVEFSVLIVLALKGRDTRNPSILALYYFATLSIWAEIGQEAVCITTCCHSILIKACLWPCKSGLECVSEKGKQQILPAVRLCASALYWLCIEDLNVCVQCNDLQLDDRRQKRNDCAPNSKELRLV